MAKKIKSAYVCTNCSYQVNKWLGRCPECHEWNTLQEEVIHKESGHKKIDNLDEIARPMLLDEISQENYERIKTNLSEFDRVMGNGVVKGSLILIGGEPGIGKSTLLMEVMGRFANLDNSSKVLYVSGEESAGQIADRMRRLEINKENYFIYNETIWGRIKEQISKIKPKFLVIDSIQTTISSDLDSAPGTVSQIREVAYELLNYTKSKGITCFVIGHITKEGSIAGPKILEHMVDTVIYFEGDQFGHYRLLRVIKNRFGNTNEVGLFEMRENGLREVSNPSQYFLEEHFGESFGRSLTCIIEGTRPLFVEIQALVVENKFNNARRTTQGIDNNRLAMIVAVIEKYCGIPIGLNDVYVNVVGGMKLTGRESDLSILASLLSSYKSRPLNQSTVFIGEVGLTGEVRSAAKMEVRVKEMEYLKYKRLVTSQKIANELKGKTSIEVIGIKKVSELDELI